MRAERADVVALFLLILLMGLIAGYGNRPQFDFHIPVQAGVGNSAFANADIDPVAHSRQYREVELQERFDQAVAMLHAKQYDFAIKALHRVIELAPQMAEAYVNMGYALIGLENWPAARDFFNTAIDMRPFQANAYWGLAIALEELDDLEGALGAMRTFIHLSPPNDPFLRKARSALWEWESALKRGPLREEEQEWIERRSREWEEKDGPEADAPEAQSHAIDVTAPH